MRRRIALLVFAGLSPLAAAQYFNIDIDVGSGVPSAAFGAAAGQVGHWNAIGYSTGPTQLSNLAGSLTGVSVSLASTGIGYSGGWWSNPINTGDYAALLNDAADTSPGQTLTFTFTGLASGQYTIYTYAVAPNNGTPTQTVGVSNQIGGAQFVTGPMPGNSFAQGLTHAINVSNVTSGTMVVSIASASNVYVNGFQIVPSPGPGALLGAGLLLGVRRRR